MDPTLHSVPQQTVPQRHGRARSQINSSPTWPFARMSRRRLRIRLCRQCCSCISTFCFVYTDRHTGIQHRHHVHESMVQKTLAQAVRFESGRQRRLKPARLLGSPKSARLCQVSPLTGFSGNKILLFADRFFIREREPRPCVSGTARERNAVGMALTGHPPHRSVREVFPHTAPALSRARNLVSGCGWRIRGRGKYRRATRNIRLQFQRRQPRWLRRRSWRSQCFVTAFTN